MSLSKKVLLLVLLTLHKLKLEKELLKCKPFFRKWRNLVYRPCVLTIVIQTKLIKGEKHGAKVTYDY